MNYNNTNCVTFFRKKRREKHLFIDNYINNYIKQSNGEGTYGACDLRLNDII